MRLRSALPLPHRAARRTAAALLGAGLSLGVLAACGSSDGLSDAGPASPTSATTPAPSASAVTPPPAPPTPAPQQGGSTLATDGAFTMSAPDGSPMVSGAQFASMPYVLPLNPAGPQETMVRWVDGLGVPPAAADTGTVYVLGHAWGAAPLVFNPISEQVTAAVDFSAPETIPATDGQAPIKRFTSTVLNGSTITMTAGESRRTWRVTRSWLVDKNEAIVDPDIMDQSRRNRIILIACSVSGANDLGYNVIVEGELV